MIKCAVENLRDVVAVDFQRNARALTEPVADPPRVEQITGCAVGAHFIGQHLRVDLGKKRQKRRTEAGRKRRGRILAHIGLGTAQCGGVPGHEVVHGLGRGQPGDRREHTKGIGGEENNRLGVSAHAARNLIRDVVERIRAPGVFGNGIVVVIRDAGFGIDRDVFDDRTELDRVPDQRLAFLAHLDALRITAALEVEHAGVAPSVLVIADQSAIRIGRQRGLAGSAETEKYRHVALIAHVGRTVHGEYIFLRQDKVQHAENALLHFAGVLGAADEHRFACEIDDDKRLTVDLVFGRVGVKATGVDHGPFGNVRCQLFGGRATEQLLHKQIVPGEFGDHADWHRIARVGPGETVHDKQLLALEVGQHIRAQRRVGVLGHRLVHLAPPDLVLDRRLLHDPLVLG